MKSTAIKKIIFELIEQYGYENAKKTIDSIFEIYTILNKEK